MVWALFSKRYRVCQIVGDGPVHPCRLEEPPQAKTAEVRRREKMTSEPFDTHLATVGSRCRSYLPQLFLALPFRTSYLGNGDQNGLVNS
jgi:hypothetical protein